MGVGITPDVILKRTAFHKSFIDILFGRDKEAIQVLWTYRRSWIALATVKN